MARTQRDTVEYFPHDSRSSEGDTLTILEARFGNDRYAFWFKLLEKLSTTEGHYLDCNDNIKWQLLCARAHSTPEKAITIVETLAEVKAIDPELWKYRLIWCQNLVDNIADVYKNRRREIPQKPITTGKNPITTVDNGISTIGSTPPQNASVALHYTPPESKVKESKSKVKESIIDKIPEWVNQEVWDAFLEMRKKQKAVPTERAKELLFIELDRLRVDGDDPNAVLNQSIMNNYKGVFALKKNGGNGQHGIDQRHTQGVPGNRPAGAFDNI